MIRPAADPTRIPPAVALMVPMLRLLCEVYPTTSFACLGRHDDETIVEFAVCYVPHGYNARLSGPWPGEPLGAAIQTTWSQIAASLAVHPQVRLTPREWACKHLHRTGPRSGTAGGN